MIFKDHFQAHLKMAQSLPLTLGALAESLLIQANPPYEQPV
jgi:hypothetical protein